jgi:membrane-associated phospholipid phosphatase
MSAIWNLGITFILFLQSLGGWLTGIMQAFSFLGNEQFYLLVAPAIFWCLDASLGMRMGLGLMLSGSINSTLKLVFQHPRPYWIDPRVRALSLETSFGLPSGHAQNAVVVWGLLAAWVQRTWAWVAAIVIIFLIGLSRMQLGVHFPTDVLAGWLIGALILWAILRFERPFMARFLRYRADQQILLTLAVSLLLVLVGALLRLTLTGWRLPDAWIPQIAATHGPELVNPLELSGLISNAGTFFGLALGGIWLKQRGWFEAGGPLWKRALRYLIGLAGVVVFWYVLGALFPRGETLLPLVLRYLRYTLIGFWVAGLGPLLFIRLKLAEPKPG